MIPEDITKHWVFRGEWGHVSGRKVEASEVVGYNVADYFDADGQYKGPDEHGIYPRWSRPKPAGGVE